MSYASFDHFKLLRKMMILAMTAKVAKNTWDNGVSSPKEGINAGTTA